MNKEYLAAVEQNGFAIIPNFFSDESISLLPDELAEIENTQAVIRRKQVTYGIRNLLNLSSSVRQLVNSEKALSLVQPLLGTTAFAVRAIFFDKTPETNWGVAWHQDLAIPIRQKIKVEGFGQWSVKAGVPHAHAPACVLEKMLTLRLHLDDTTAINGALRVLPGSHLDGRLTDKEIDERAWKEEFVTCEVLKGGILAMRPLLLHSSLPSQQPAHRRIVHLEFAAEELPGGLEWFRA